MPEIMIWAKSWQTPRRSANDIGGVVEAMFGINAEGKSLEAIAPPLTEVGSGKRGVDEHDRYRGGGQL